MAILAWVRIHILPFVSVLYVFSTAYTVKRGWTIGKWTVSTVPAAVSHALYNLARYCNQRCHITRRKSPRAPMAPCCHDTLTAYMLTIMIVLEMMEVAF
jgi:hypothetical protein